MPIAILVLLAFPTAPGAIQSAAVEFTVVPDRVQLGDAFLLDADCHCSATSGSVSTALLTKPVPLFREPGSTAWRAILGVDLERARGPYAITLTFELPDGSALSATHTVQVTTRQFATRRLRVEPGFVNPPAEVEQRILAEAVRLRAVLSAATDRTPMGPLQPPLPARVNSNFGSRSIFNGQPRSPHAGVDFSGDVGTPILAPGAAIVALAEDLYFTGQTVILDHGQGLFSILAHLSEIVVAEGARVERGETVGTLGATGRVTGPHLHWGVRLHGARVDPLSVLRILTSD
jgi:murein DD-endopeptidase MepM/ murein hydrolase activator NlpD